MLGGSTRSAAPHAKFLQHWTGENTYTTYTHFPKKVYRAANSSTGGFSVTIGAAQAGYHTFSGKLATSLKTTDTDLEPSRTIAWSEQVELLETPFYADW
ncbi:Uu.00g063460.m01.CDS01 [Anthostomella pinea]|uniref:Uu.00g063460.m01.CDS01 n=1 Tax=Anthostomella pinea TaxID=933095 RepID=A0AAI8VMT4_9PEZI|nr:Uu.00g063460.m01.CDS01 [Anthostomella pinea]